jgi:tellurite resistance protein
MPPSAAAPLKFLSPAWFSIVMGLSGLALAWLRAEPLMGELTGAIALVIGAVTALIFVLLAGASLLRLQRHPEAWREDRQHPVRHAFMAALPAALILLATLATALFGPLPLVRVLWWCGSLSQLGVTLWVLSRWWLGNKAGGLVWPALTPVLFIPIVGNVLVPLAGVPLGQADWAAAQFGLGLLFWPVLLALLLVRVATQGMWPERLLPANFIFVAPPAVIGLSALQLGAPRPLGWMLWGAALFTLLWVGTQARRIVAQPFALTHWGVSFPLAAFTALTLRLAEPGNLLTLLGPLLLALSSLVMLGLLLATWRGLRDGSLLAPEPVAAITPIGAAAGTP